MSKINYTIINTEVIESTMMNNHEMIKQFISLYITQSPIDMQAVENAIADGDPKEISSKAHHIKPTMEYIGATDLRMKFQELENLGKERADLEIIKTLYAQIKSVFDILLIELNAYNEQINQQNAD